LKREFGYYRIELVAEQVAEPKQLEMACVADVHSLASMERYDPASGSGALWRPWQLIARHSAFA
jgi:hypothetical protein